MGSHSDRLMVVPLNALKLGDFPAILRWNRAWPARKGGGTMPKLAFFRKIADLLVVSGASPPPICRHCPPTAHVVDGAMNASSPSPAGSSGLFGAPPIVLALVGIFTGCVMD